MPDGRRKSCRCCGKTEAEAGKITWAGNCIDCAKALLDENVSGIHERSGFAHRRRLRGIIAAAERALLDDTASTA